VNVEQAPGPVAGQRLKPPLHAKACATFFLGFAALLIAIHLPYLKLPFHWDEAGQFVPAALDIFREGRFIPRSTVPNVHPPGLMALLALVWKIFGFSILASRLTMLIIASFGVLFAFLLAIRLARGTSGAPAFAAALFLIVSPVFYTQSMMVLLDMPAMVLTLLALLLFLDARFAACAAVCTALALVKETAITTPFVLAAWLWLREGRRRQALYFLAPAAALGTWLIVLRRATGHWLGNEEFAQFNVGAALEPFHMGFAFLARAWYLFAADGHFLGAIALFFGWRLLRGKEWSIVLLVAAAQLVLVTVFGGAELERYLLPVLPVLYSAFATAASIYSQRLRLASHAVLIALLVAGWFWNSPFPWPYEDNLAMVDFVRLQQSAAQYLEAYAPGARIASAWPFTDAVQYPDLGYVERPMKARKASGLHLTEIADLGPGSFDVLVMFVNKRPVRGSIIDVPLLRPFLRHYYDYEPQASPEEIREGLGYVPFKRWERHGQWIEIYVPEP